MELKLIDQTTLSGEGLLERLIKKEAERDSYIMDHNAWDILNQECKEIILAISDLPKDNADGLVVAYRDRDCFRYFPFSGKYQCISSYEKDWIPEIMPDWEKMKLPIKLVFVLSGIGGGVYHINVYTLIENAEAARL